MQGGARWRRHREDNQVDRDRSRSATHHRRKARAGPHHTERSRPCAQRVVASVGTRQKRLRIPSFVKHILSAFQKCGVRLDKVRLTPLQPRRLMITQLLDTATHVAGLILEIERAQGRSLAGRNRADGAAPLIGSNRDSGRARSNRARRRDRFHRSHRGSDRSTAAPQFY